MPLLLLKDLPRYDCLLKAAEQYPSLNPTRFDAFLHLLRTGDDLFAAQSRFLSRHNISQSRLTVLMLLSRPEPSTPAELASELDVTRATMTGLLDTLEKDGLALREAHPADRRTIHVSLTAKGQSVVQAILPDYFHFVSAILEPLDTSEQNALVSLLQKIQQGNSLGRGPAHVVHSAAI